MDKILTHLPDQFEVIPSKHLMDFLTINPKSTADLNILATWEAHFVSVGMPYQVRQVGANRVLYKERRV